jgi:predicted acyl esterase
VDPVGELCFGLGGSRLGMPVHEQGDLNDVQLAWFDRHLASEAPSAEESQAPVRIFVMGRNEWRDEQAWPLERARDERWFLGADGSLRPLVGRVESALQGPAVVRRHARLDSVRCP